MTSHRWETCRRTLEWGARPLVIGILNLTPDSFSDGGIYEDPNKGIHRALEMEAEGADIIDIGGESTRPKSSPVSPETEWCRLGPVLEGLHGRLRIPISVDTSKAEVARRALAAGAEIVNDVSAGEWDSGMWPMVAKTRAGYILMHCQGRPATMQDSPQYEDVAGEVSGYLQRRLAEAEAAGIAKSRIVLDPGLGFGKTFEHNMALLRSFQLLAKVGRPVLAAASRKSFVKKLGGEEHVQLSSHVIHAYAAMHGAALWRVHDVATAVAAAKVMAGLNEVSPQTDKVS
ncbi:MAG: dihydropteroate synthase [Candidatus Methylacidiphilales bacterium]|nr:dihydropteroate synthase [Candidatus Methylacidiphilales bacterium]